MRTIACSGYPSACGSISAVYARITPRSSSRRIRSDTPGADIPTCAANSLSEIRASTTSIPRILWSTASIFDITGRFLTLLFKRYQTACFPSISYVNAASPHVTLDARPFPEDPMHGRTRGAVEMTAAMTISGTIGWFVVHSGLPVMDVVFWRCAFGALALLAVCAALGLLRGRLTLSLLAFAALGGACI